MVGRQQGVLQWQYSRGRQPVGGVSSLAGIKAVNKLFHCEGPEQFNADREVPCPRERDIIPLGRRGLVADVASAAMFMLSDLSLYVTGQNLAVDGGLSQCGPHYEHTENIPVFLESAPARDALAGEWNSIVPRRPATALIPAVRPAPTSSLRASRASVVGDQRSIYPDVSELEGPTGVADRFLTPGQ